MVTAAKVNAAPPQLFLFRSYAPRISPREYEKYGYLNPDKLLAWKAARATSWVPWCGYDDYKRHFVKTFHGEHLNEIMFSALQCRSCVLRILPRLSGRCYILQQSLFGPSDRLLQTAESGEAQKHSWSSLAPLYPYFGIGFQFLGKRG